ncbi:MAG TPA: DUF1918 domain-containing protein [Acidimicrobiales bacterium]|nr:DUF1918 domain-containing protein [Acidimicrobiales bacterium]
MHAEVSDRLVVHGAEATLTGEIVEVVGENSYRVRWEDGHESLISPGPATTVKPAEHDTEAELRAEWEAAKAARHARTTAWRRGITAGVGREASLAQKKIGTLASGG